MSASPSPYTLTAFRLQAESFWASLKKFPVGSDLPKKAAAARGLVFDAPIMVESSGPMSNAGNRICYSTKVSLAEKINSLIHYTMGLKLETWLSEAHAKEMCEYIKAHKDRVAEISATKGVAPDQADELATIAVRLFSNLMKVFKHLWPLAM